MFYGIIVYMYFLIPKNTTSHISLRNLLNILTVISIEDGELLEGNLPKKKLKMVQAWVAIHEDELMADWKLAVEGKELFKIDPLK